MEKCARSHRNIIEAVKIGGIGESMGIEKGDCLIRINGSEIEDIIDYIYLINDEFLLVEIEKADGEIWELEIEKNYDEDLGLVFVSPTIDRIKRCRNKCIFCFVDQMPEGMRSSLYVKDDDYRLSVLHGNFVTLSNLKAEDFEKIFTYHVSPVNISVHATDPDVRRFMMGNQKGDEILNQIKKLADRHILMNAQIVLCPGINDGAVLDRTLAELAAYYPDLQSIAIVPVGLTKYREGLFQLNSVDKHKAREIIKQVEAVQAANKKLVGQSIVFLSDEFFVVAGVDLPAFEDYEGFPQIENGVGLIRKFERQVEDALDDWKSESGKSIEIAMVTGKLSFDFMTRVAKRLENAMNGLTLKVYAIENEFFGKDITVTGLMTGRDLMKALEDVEESTVIVPAVMFNEETGQTLDDFSMETIGKESKKNLKAIEVDGRKLVNEIAKLRKWS